MTRNHYPKCGGIDGLSTRPFFAKQKNLRCACCERPAGKVVDVQVDYFRGDDESYPACPEHAKLARKNIRAFLALARS